MLAVIDDVFICFVSHDNQIAIDSELRNLFCFAAGEYDTRRIRRRIEVKHPRVRRCIAR